MFLLIGVLFAHLEGKKQVRITTRTIGKCECGTDPVTQSRSNFSEPLTGRPLLHELNMQDVQPIYKWIVDSVIAKSRTSFLQEGVDECALYRMSVGASGVQSQTSPSNHIFKHKR
jgi:hypothetical protein